MTDKYRDNLDASATQGEIDLRISEALNQINCEYEFDHENSAFIVNTNLDNDRSHYVFINSTTEVFLGIEMRKIFAPSIHISGQFDANTSNLLLRENAKTIFGNWLVDVSDDMNFAVFSVTVTASLGAKALGDMIDWVAYVADSMEERLTGMDSI